MLRCSIDSARSYVILSGAETVLRVVITFLANSASDTVLATAVRDELRLKSGPLRACSLGQPHISAPTPLVLGIFAEDVQICFAGESQLDERSLYLMRKRDNRHIKTFEPR